MSRRSRTELSTDARASPPIKDVDAVLGVVLSTRQGKEDDFCVLPDLNCVHMTAWIQKIALTTVMGRRVLCPASSSRDDTTGTATAPPTTSSSDFSQLNLSYVEHRGKGLAIIAGTGLKQHLNECIASRCEYIIVPVQIGKRRATSDDYTHACVLVIETRKKRAYCINGYGLVNPMPYQPFTLDKMIAAYLKGNFDHFADYAYFTQAMVYAFDDNDPERPFPLARHRLGGEVDAHVLEGPQHVEQQGSYKKGEINGYCLAWSLLLAHYRILNPHVSLYHIILHFTRNALYVPTTPHAATSPLPLQRWLRSVIRRYNCEIVSETKCLQQDGQDTCKASSQ